MGSDTFGASNAFPDKNAADSFPQSSAFSANSAEPKTCSLLHKIPLSYSSENLVSVFNHGNPDVRKAYDDCVATLRDFRSHHINLVTK